MTMKILPQPCKNQKWLCFYHYPCFDGLIAAWVLSLKFPKFISFEPVSYTTPVDIDSEIFKESQKVVFLDFVPPRDLLSKILDSNKSVLIIDHHPETKGLMDVGMRNVEIIFDDTKSGASLVWDLCFGKDRPDLINLIERIDLNKIPPVTEVKSRKIYFQASAFVDQQDINASLEKSKWISKAMGLSINEIAQNGIVERDKRLKGIKQATQKCYKFKRGRYEFSIVNADIDKYGHEFFPYFIEQENVDIAIAWIETDNYIRLNIRSQNNSSVISFRDELIQKYCGKGGGHSYASVVRLSEEEFYKFKQDYLNIQSL